MMAAHPAAPFDQGEGYFFAADATGKALAAMLILFKATNIGFVDFNGLALSA